jgi:hypothetical protein
MNYQKKFARFFQDISLAIRDKFKLTPVEASEPLTRFVFVPKYFDSAGRIKQAAFAPSKKNNDLSVYRTKELAERDLLYIAQRYVVEKMANPQPLAGWATFSSDIPKKHNLRLVADGKPHKRHLNLEEWPSEHLAIRLEMANGATSRKL